MAMRPNISLLQTKPARSVPCIIILLSIVTIAQVIAIYYTWPMFYFPPLAAFFGNALILNRFASPQRNGETSAKRGYRIGIALAFRLAGLHVGYVWAVNTFGA